MYKNIYEQYVMDNKVWAYFFCFVEQSAQWKEKGFLVACKDKAKIQLSDSKSEFNWYDFM